MFVLPSVEGEHRLEQLLELERGPNVTAEAHSPSPTFQKRWGVPAATTSPGERISAGLRIVLREESY